MNMTTEEKIKGMMLGYALGDALGIGTEFMTRREVERYYPDGLHSFSQIIRDAHRSQWPRGNWSNDTEMLIVLAESVDEAKGIDILNYAAKLGEWVKKEPVDLVPVYRCVLSDPQWVAKPLTTCRKVWKEQNLVEASNEALYRALITGVVSGENLLEETRLMVEITHIDNRCIATAVVIARMAQSLMWEGKPASPEELRQLADVIDHRTVQYITAAEEAADISELNLDDDETIWYTRKTMAAVLWAIWHCDSPRQILHTLVHCGGDADTNAALGMGLAGLRYGAQALPDIVKDLNEYDRIDKAADLLIAFVETLEK